MLKCSVIALDITNLTDARYFAARGADYLVYDISKIGISEVMAIAEWVEGVKTLILLDTDHLHLIDEVKLRIDPYAVGTKDLESMDRISPYVTEEEVFLYLKETEDKNARIILASIDLLENGIMNAKRKEDVLEFHEVHPTQKEIMKFLSNNHNGNGLILKGGSEEETGLKSFENLDEIFDLLEE